MTKDIKPLPVFVFGSNLAGAHGAGAAMHALKFRGAIWGVGEGHHGQSYALPTKDHAINTLPLETIKTHVEKFIEYAKSHPDVQFNVTRIGCGLAGLTDEEIAPMFKGAPPNCQLPHPNKGVGDEVSWRKLNGEGEYFHGER